MRERALYALVLGLATVAGCGANKRTPGQTLQDAIERGDVKAVAKIIHSGVNANSRCGDGSDPEEFWCLPIHVAARNGNAVIVRLLLDRGADANARSYCGETPIMHIVGSDNRPGQQECIRILLEHGADLDAAHNGDTALSMALRYGNTEMARFLTELGATRSEME